MQALEYLGRTDRFHHIKITNFTVWLHWIWFCFSIGELLDHELQTFFKGPCIIFRNIKILLLGIYSLLFWYSIYVFICICLLCSVFANVIFIPHKYLLYTIVYNMCLFHKNKWIILWLSCVLKCTAHFVDVHWTRTLYNGYWTLNKIIIIIIIIIIISKYVVLPFH